MQTPLNSNLKVKLLNTLTPKQELVFDESLKQLLSERKVHLEQPFGFGNTVLCAHLWRAVCINQGKRLKLLFISTSAVDCNRIEDVIYTTLGGIKVLGLSTRPSCYRCSFHHTKNILNSEYDIAIVTIQDLLKTDITVVQSLGSDEVPKCEERKFYSKEFFQDFDVLIVDQFQHFQKSPWSDIMNYNDYKFIITLSPKTNT